MVCHALDEGALPKLLGSPSPPDWEKAVLVLRHCTAIVWESTNEFGEREPSPKTVTDDYWLKELIDHHAKMFGAKAAKGAANVFLERIRETFGSGSRRLYSQTYRPAVEDHAQNHGSCGPENWAIEGLRDVVLSWCEHDPEEARAFVQTLLADELQVLRRAAIYVQGQQWSKLRSLYASVLGLKIFDTGHLHELYNLLKEHFTELTNEEKAATVSAIRQIPKPSWGDDPEQSLRWIQYRWLSAFAGMGYAPADEWIAELKADPTVGSLSDHPDFDSYMETWSGPGPSPYSVQELTAFATAGTLVEELNSFEPREVWRGPTSEGLLDALEQAVRIAPEQFLRLLPQFLRAKRPFQHAVIRGLQHAWEETGSKRIEIDWNQGWENLISFSEQLIGVPTFWEETVPQTAGLIPNRDWIVSAIADFLKDGTRNDERAHSSHILPRARSLIQILLANVKTVDQPSDDPMFQAINSLKGKALEALFSHALRACRLGDREKSSHAEDWAGMMPLFRAELENCRNGNYEFSTLAGAYLAQLDYMDREWAKGNIDHIFPPAFPLNSTCALTGLAYTPFTLPVYKLLVEGGVLDRGLRYELKGRSAREKLIERIGGAYLWGEEPLESSRFSFLFESGSEDDLEILASLFWRVRGADHSTAQRERVLKYWERCVAWARGRTAPPAKLLSTLSTLSPYLTTADGTEKQMLEAVAPYIRVGYKSDNFFAELDRLLQVSPEAVSAVLGKALDAHVPDYDYRDRLKVLLRGLAEKGQKRDAIAYAERLRNLPGMQALFDDLTRAR